MSSGGSRWSSRTSYLTRCSAAGMPRQGRCWRRRAGRGAPPTPWWLVEAVPLRVLWEWADGIARQDARLLRAVAQRLQAMTCPYEAALALRDAGDLRAAYQALRVLGAVPAREQLAA